MEMNDENGEIVAHRPVGGRQLDNGAQTAGWVANRTRTRTRTDGAPNCDEDKRGEEGAGIKGNKNNTRAEGRGSTTTWSMGIKVWELGIYSYE
jgi:hypothetical protein